VLASRDGGYQTPTELVQQHPYLFWRVPTQIYKTSLAATPPDGRVLDALQQVLAQDRFWAGVKTPMEGMLEMLNPQGVETVAIHNVLRHVGAGGQNVVSPSSGRMFTLLGRQEWSHRLKTVQRLLRE
jgi:glutamyl-tRNA synthetase